MLVRDAQGIICQHDKFNNNQLDSASGGDSCARTGPLARSGSLVDIENVPKFILPTNEVVRHPTAPGYNTPDKTSRDNITQFFCTDLDSQRAAALHYAEAGWVNKDFLAPDVRLYLYQVARVKPPLWLRVVGPIWLRLSILWAAHVQPDEEVNQLACVCSVMCPEYARLLLTQHKTIEQNLADYWNFWRDQSEIGEAILSNLRKAAN